MLPSIARAATPLGKWQGKEGAYNMLLALMDRAPEEAASLLPDIVPMVSDGMVDARNEVCTCVVWQQGGCPAAAQ